MFTVINNDLLVSRSRGIKCKCSRFISINSYSLCPTYYFFLWSLPIEVYLDHSLSESVKIISSPSALPVRGNPFLPPIACGSTALSLIVEGYSIL